MVNSCRLIELTENESKEIDGGTFPMLIIKLFMPSLEGIFNFQEGLRDGYIRTTPA